MPRMKPSQRPRHYTVYYGYGPLPGLERFDWVILEPAGWLDQDRRRLLAQGPCVLAYLAMLEALPWVARDAGLRDTDYLHLTHLDGRIWDKPDLNTRVVDPRSPTWRRYLEDRVRQLRHQGFHGVFLDTLGDVEDQVAAPLTGWLVPHAADLVRMVRSLWPDGLIALNNGIWLLLPLVAPLIDAICWEAPLTDVALRTPWAQAALDLLARTTVGGDRVVLLLTHIPEGDAAALDRFRGLAARLGFIPYAAPADYAQAVRLPTGEVVDGPRR
jgi:hypothetical protein